VGLLLDRLQQWEERLAQSEAARDQQGAQLLELKQVIQQLHGAQNAMLQTQATAAFNPVATQSRPPPMRSLFDGTNSQFRSWRTAIEDRLTSDRARLTPRQQWICIHDSHADYVQKRLANCFESGEAHDWNANALLQYLETLCANNTTIAVARMELHQLR
ncbi:hypothetical protein E4U59_005408, partial [Claviceps monticola]